MNRTYFPLAGFAMASVLGGQALAAGAMADMKGMPASNASAKTGQATGIVSGFDTKAGVVTIKHGAIPGVGWPAMTMTFKATSAALLKGVQSGDEAAFTVMVNGRDNEAAALKKQ